MSESFYITTPIYYPNGEPHLGHVYTTLAADTVARYHRLKGDDTFFLTGTDEHGVKMVKTAAGLNLTPAELADKMSGAFRQLWPKLHVTNDDFIRTPEPRHHRAVQAVVDKLLANDDIYLGSYSGWYDEGQEEFVTESTAKESDYKSAITGRPLTRYEEPTYFFRLTKYVPKLLQYIADHPGFIQPESRHNEVVSKLKQGVDDLSISRSTLEWGIKMPNDPKHVVYVWIDALTNYITALGYGSDDASKMSRFWPANVHVVGKDILWFHTVYWPAMLMGLGLDLPKTVFAHGMWLNDGVKMGKSLNNFIDLPLLQGIVDKYGLDALRFYLLRAAPFGSDLNWSDTEFAASYFELSKKLGNCLNRTTNMTARYRFGVVPEAGPLNQLDESVLAMITALPGSLAAAYGRLALQDAATLPIDLVRVLDGYIEATQPFKLAKDPAMSEKLGTVLNILIRGMHAVLVGLLPILPDKAAAGLSQLGVDSSGRHLADLYATFPKVGDSLGTSGALFPPVEVK